MYSLYTSMSVIVSPDLRGTASRVDQIDIVSKERKIADPRAAFLGRFHHFIWKPDRIT